MNIPPRQPEGAGHSITPEAAVSARIFDEADFKKRLADEYKILQDKIDKIGGFRFTIKGWSVTAVLGASVAGSTSNSLLAVFTIGLVLILMLVFFFRLEFEQVKLSRLFGDRARRLEVAFRRIDLSNPKATSLPIRVPYTAHEVAFVGRYQRPKTWTGCWHVYGQAHIWFYLVLILVPLFLIIVRWFSLK